MDLHSEENKNAEISGFLFCILTNFTAKGSPRITLQGSSREDPGPAGHIPMVEAFFVFPKGVLHHLWTKHLMMKQFMDIPNTGTKYCLFYLYSTHLCITILSGVLSICLPSPQAVGHPSVNILLESWVKQSA